MEISFKKPIKESSPSVNEAILSSLAVILSKVTSIDDRFDALECEISLIRLTLTKLERYSMTLPSVVETAIAAEIEEGLKLQSTITELKTKVAQLEQLLAETPTPGVGEAIVNIQELVDQIAAVNPTPVSDAIVSEVVSNPEIPTPAVVETAPEVAPEVIQEPAVVEAAVEAIVATDEATAVA